MNSSARPAACSLQPGQRLDIVQRQQAPVGHHHQAANVGITCQYLLERRLQRRCLGRVAIKDLVIDRHAVLRLHHAQHELARNDPFLGHPEAAHVALLLAQALGADGGQVIEHHREILIDERAQQSGNTVIHSRLVIHERIHAAQQLLVREPGRIDTGHAHRVQPAQHAEFGVGITQPVEDHHADGVLYRIGEAGPAKDGGKPIETQLVPQGIEGPDIPQRKRGLKSHLGRIAITRHSPLGTQQTAQQGVKLPAALVDASEGGYRALAGLALFIAKGLHQPRIAVTAGGGDFDEHAPECSVAGSE